LLAILRNPVDRAYSAYTHGLREWKEPAKSFEEALALEQERIRAGWGMLWHYTQAGFYYEQLKRYYQVFDPQQIKVVLHDDLVADVDKLLQGIFVFLEVDPDFKPDTTARPNVSGFPKNATIHQILRRLFINDNPIKRISQALLPKSFRQRITHKLVEANMEKRRMSREVRTQLQNIFKEDIQHLEGLINRDLSH
jgi:hypothetical protein